MDSPARTTATSSTQHVSYLLLPGLDTDKEKSKSNDGPSKWTLIRRWQMRGYTKGDRMMSRPPPSPPRHKYPLRRWPKRFIGNVSWVLWGYARVSARHTFNFVANHWQIFLISTIAPPLGIWLLDTFLN